MPGIVVPHAPEALQIAVGKIRPGAAVGMDVDEAGDHEAAPEIDLLFPKGILRRGEASLPHGKAPVFEASVFSINVSVMIDHFHPSGGLSAAALWPTRRVFFIRQHDADLIKSTEYSSRGTGLPSTHNPAHRRNDTRKLADLPVPAQGDFLSPIQTPRVVLSCLSECKFGRSGEAS